MVWVKFQRLNKMAGMFVMKRAAYSYLHQAIHMKLKGIFSLASKWRNFIVTGFVLALSCFMPVYAQTIDEVVLVVDDLAITAREFAVLRVIQNPDLPYALVSPDLNDESTNAIVNDILLSAHAKRIAPDATVSDADVKAAFASLANRNRLTADQLLAQLTAQGVDMQIFNASMRQRLLVQNVLGQRIASSVNVTDIEVQDFINNRPELRAQSQKQFHAFHMVVPVEDGLKKSKIRELKAIAETAQARLIAGESFASVAQDISEVQLSGDGGDLGWKKQDELPELFVSVLDEMKEGQISAPIESSNGFHILALAEMKSAAKDAREYKVRHILKVLSPGADEVAMRATLNNLRLQILAGVDLGVLAAKESQDTGSAEAGGELGWIQLKQVDPQFAEAMISLKLGEISKPVRTSFGLHLIQILQERKPAGVSSLESQVQQQIFAQRLDEAMEDLLNDLKQVAVVEVVDSE